MQSSPNLESFDPRDEIRAPISPTPDSLDDAATPSPPPDDPPDDPPANLDAYESDFVTDDEALGIPSADLSAMPLEFTRHAHKRPKEHFHDVVAWMVQRRLHPGFAAHDPIYQLAFRKIDDEARAYVGSKFASAAWKPDFLRALRARPHLDEMRVGALLGGGCEACGRQGHAATWMLRFHGRPYETYSLEAVRQVEEPDEDEGNEEDGDVDVHGERLSSESRKFYLGK